MTADSMGRAPDEASSISSVRVRERRICLTIATASCNVLGGEEADLRA